MRRNSLPGSRVTFAAALLLLAPVGLAQTPGASPPPDDPGPSDTSPDPSPDVTFYVAPWGNLSVTWHTNTVANPFLTLQQAEAEVYDYKSGLGSAQHIQVQIAGGLYHMTYPAVFSSADSGWDTAMIEYIAADLVNPNTSAHSGTDVLFTGGIQLTGWTSTTVNGVSMYYCTVPESATDIRDVWVNNQRMIRARFPDPADPTDPCGAAYFADPSTPPCPNNGFLVFKDVSSVPVGTSPTVWYQRVVLRTGDGSDFPTLSDWSHVEIDGSRTYNAPQQVVTSVAPVTDHPEEVALSFQLTTVGSGTEEQDLGAIGCFYHDNWQGSGPPTRCDQDCKRGYLQFVGEDNCTGMSGPEVRYVPGQAFLVNDLKFITIDKEWYFDAANHRLYLKLCTDPDNCTVVVPVTDQLLVLDQVANVKFYGLDFAHTYQPFPTELGITPGYANVQAQLAWDDSEARPRQNNQLSAAVTMLGCTNCWLQRCRVGHTGGNGVIVGTDTVYPPGSDPEYIESNECRVQTCEIFDIGGHGVYVGDEYCDADHDWAAEADSSDRTDPSNGNVVTHCRIETFAVIYRDSVGIYAGHTRDLYLGYNQLDYGTYSGINIGTYQAHHIDSDNLPGSCTVTDPDGHDVTSTPISVSQNTEGTKITHNDIGPVMLRQTDGGGVYMQGSHLASTNAPYGSELSHNYVHDIILNPYVNADGVNPPGATFMVCKGFYFESGSDGWHVLDNYIARVQSHYSFAPGSYLGGVCGLLVPTSFVCVTDCAGTQSVISHWYSPSWPTPWPFCSAPCTGIGGYCMPAQTWYGNAPNYWLDPTSSTAYELYQSSTGYGDPVYHSAYGGMYAITGSGQSNIVVTSTGSSQTSIINAAGPGTDDLAWMNMGKQIHRTDICTTDDSTDLGAQIP